MQAIVSDQSAIFVAQIIGTGPEFTVVAALELPRGNWVAFATVALANNGGTPGTTTIVQACFLLDGEIYSTQVQTDLAVADTDVGSVSGLRVVPLTAGLTLTKTQTLQVGCVTASPSIVMSQPTTITAIQVDSLTRIQDQAPGIS